MRHKKVMQNWYEPKLLGLKASCSIFLWPAMCSSNQVVASSAPARTVHETVIVTEYEYYADEEHIGTLFLKEPIKQCSWWSRSTGLRTGWHGEWEHFNGSGFIARFDCLGLANSKQHTVVYGDAKGSDYAGRTIEVIMTGKWEFDQEQAEYVSR